jgi:chlorophyll/bacteriochlorophyll a synthase
MALPTFAPLQPLPPARAVLGVLKPVTWFPPMWAFACGAVASGAPLSDRAGLLAAGVVLAGPLVCATSQAVNDWFDRHVDAINEPQRPIPSGLLPGRWGLGVACFWTLLSLWWAAALGLWAFGAAVLGLALAWAYSAPPLRLKRNGWWGNAACGLCYEGLAWFTGAALMQGGLPAASSIAFALLYSAGAHGIMTLNDFKSMAGDRRMGIASLPVQLGAPRAARMACTVMLLPQAVVVAVLQWGLDRPLHALAIAALIAVQAAMMRRFLREPVKQALWYSAAGVPVFVTGMMVAAFALRGLH